MDVVDNWTVEEIFIQKMLFSDSIPLDFKLIDVIKYLQDPNINNSASYKIWKKVSNSIIEEFDTSQYVTFEVNYDTKTSLINETELNLLKEKIKINEIALVLRADRIALNEATHLEDELWDDR